MLRLGETHTSKRETAAPTARLDGDRLLLDMAGETRWRARKKRERKRGKRRRRSNGFARRVDVELRWGEIERRTGLENKPPESPRNRKEEERDEEEEEKRS
jgi:hypothetical protein